MFRLAAVWCLGWAVWAQGVSGERLRAHVRFLASDLLEGRGTGERGGELAVEYLAAQLAVAGAKPAGEAGGWFQSVPLVATRTDTGASVVAVVGGQPWRWGEEIAGHALTGREAESWSAEVVFAGYGIHAPEFAWDDYEGVDVRGRVVAVFANEPPSEEAGFFEGRALTYYGRWTYKLEEARRRGAVAVLLLHTDETAGYGWDVVRNSWSGEEARVKGSEPALAFAGWLSRAAGEGLARAGGRTLDEWLAEARRRGFRAAPVGVRVKGEIRSAVREIVVRNVAGIVGGSDPGVSDEVVAFTAHWDHLGKRDAIYNGAVDNATGCAVLLEIAREWATAPVRPRRGALFLFLAAEEAGLRGAEFYAAQPLVPLEKTVAVLNFDSYLPFGRTRDMVLDRAERTSLWPLAEGVAARLGLSLSGESRPEQGGFFRSDHFPFARRGVVAFSVKVGNQWVGRAEEIAERARRFQREAYHRPGDDYAEDWDMAGMEQAARFGLALGVEIASAEAKPRWREVKAR